MKLRPETIVPVVIGQIMLFVLAMVLLLGGAYTLGTICAVSSIVVGSGFIVARILPERDGPSGVTVPPSGPALRLSHGEAAALALLSEYDDASVEIPAYVVDGQVVYGGTGETDPVAAREAAERARQYRAELDEWDDAFRAAQRAARQAGYRV